LTPLGTIARPPRARPINEVVTRAVSKRSTSYPRRRLTPLFSGL